MLADEYLQELRELLHALPDEEWDYSFKQNVEDYPPAVVEVVRDKSTVGDHWDSEVCQLDYYDFDKAEFIAKSRTAVPKLLEEIERLRGENAHLRELFDESQADVLAAVKMCHEIMEEGITLDRAAELASNWLARGAGIPAGETEA